MEEVDRFPKLFDELDAKKKELDFESYGVSITTLEEVFLKVAEIRKDSEEDNSDK
jgi:ATP-binding cassette subfamily A (ABC1) protein 3